MNNIYICKNNTVARGVDWVAVQNRKDITQTASNVNLVSVCIFYDSRSFLMLTSLLLMLLLLLSPDVLVVPGPL